jgi:multisubunit Na+/H+ antiporter MnhB subunit
MSVMEVFDGLLCLGLLGLAWAAMYSLGLFRSVVLYMVFGLLMAVAWTRLQALDLALAEAIIGAGVTGALLLNACKSVVLDRDQATPVTRREPRPALPRPLLATGCGLLGISLAWLFLSLEPNRATANVAEDAIAGHVMKNPVTAVLLDFRGYDTLLEMTVLLLAVVAVRLLNLQGRLVDLYPTDAPRSAMLDPLAAVMIPATIVMGAYFYWAGSSRPGGAFQAGALLGAVGILLRLGGRLLTEQHQGPLLRAVLAFGLLVFSVFALAGLGWGAHAMTYPRNQSYYLMVAIEGCMTISIALTLVMLFADAPGMRLRSHR